MLVGLKPRRGSSLLASRSDRASSRWTNLSSTGSRSSAICSGRHRGPALNKFVQCGSVSCSVESCLVEACRVESCRVDSCRVGLCLAESLRNSEGLASGLGAAGTDDASVGVGCSTRVSVTICATETARRNARPSYVTGSADLRVSPCICASRNRATAGALDDGTARTSAPRSAKRSSERGASTAAGTVGSMSCATCIGA